MNLWKNCDNTGEMVNNPLSTAKYSYVGVGIPCECRRISGCHLSTPKIMLLLRTQIFWKFLTRNFDLMIFLSEFSVEWFQQFPVFLETRQNPLSPSKDTYHSQSPFSPAPHILIWHLPHLFSILWGLREARGQNLLLPISCSPTSHISISWLLALSILLPSLVSKESQHIQVFDFSFSFPCSSYSRILTTPETALHKFQILLEV